MQATGAPQVLAVVRFALVLSRERDDVSVPAFDMDWHSILELVHTPVQLLHSLE